MTLPTVNKPSMGIYIHVIIILAFTFGFGCLPSFGEITPLGMRTLGIFIGLIYGWSTIGMIWPSFLGLFALSLLPNTGAIEIFKAGFGDRITMVIFFLLLFAGLINKVGLSKYIADWCISRKFAHGRPYVILAMFCIAGALIGCFVNCFAGMILMMSVWYTFCHEANIQKGEVLPKVMIIAIIYISLMAGNILPFMGSSLLVVGLQQAYVGLSMNYVVFTVVQLIMVLTASLLYFAFIRFVIRPDVSKVANCKVANAAELKMTGQQKLVFALLVALIVFLFLPGILPKDLVLTQVLASLDIAGPLAALFVVYYVVNLRNPDVISFNEIAKDLNWSLILMFATVTPLANAVSNPESGILTYLSSILSVVFHDMPPALFVIMVLFIASIITQFCNNVAVVLMVMPIMYTFAIQLGANPLVLSILAAFNLNVAFCTPAASGPAAMIFSNKEWIPTKDAYLHGMVIFVINMVVTIIGFPLAEMFL